MPEDSALAIKAAYSLRPASEEDLPFILTSFEESIRSHIESAWGWDEAQQHQQFIHWLAEGWLQLVIINGEAAGVICVEELPLFRYIRTIFLSPRFRNNGVGSTLIHDAAAQARNSERTLVLKVIKTNPAVVLYQRLGFTLVKEDEATFHMQRP